MTRAAILIALVLAIGGAGYWLGWSRDDADEAKRDTQIIREVHDATNDPRTIDDIDRRLLELTRR